MSGKIPKSSTDLYSVVDLSKKTRRPKVIQCSQHHGHELVVVENDHTGAEKCSHSSHPNCSSEVYSRNISDLYAEVDLRKKYDKQSVELNENQNRTSNMAVNNPGFHSSNLQEPMYSTLYASQEMQTSEQMRASLTNVQKEKNGIFVQLKTSLCLVLGIVTSAAIAMLVAIVIVLFLHVNSLEKIIETNSELANVKLSEAIASHNSSFQNELQGLRLHITSIGIMQEQQISALSQNFGENFNSTSKTIAQLEQNVAVTVKNITYNCSGVVKQRLTFLSGYYVLTSSSGVLRRVYCDLTSTFGGNTTGWMRIAELDVNNCPSGMRTGTVNNNTTCEVSEDEAGCTEILYPSFNIEYTLITGKIRAYQLRSVDGFNNVVQINLRPDIPSNNSNISSNYLDGVSITSNGLHVWSFAAGCDCMTTDKPSFIKDDFTCGGRDGEVGHPQEYLWVSQQCDTNSTWFYKELPPTTADISVRVCRDQARSDEDLALTVLELYIQ